MDVSTHRDAARAGLGLLLAASVAAALAPCGAVAQVPFVPGNAIGPLQLTAPLSPSQHVDGSAFVGYRGSDGQTTGAVATWSPRSPFFARAGIEATPMSVHSSARFLWGFGVEEPRDGTFFAHVHDWGPVRQGESFTLRRAELSAGYKLPRLCAGPLCALTTAFATLPFEGGPYVGGGATLVVARTWFVAAALGWSIPGALALEDDPRRWRVYYSLGRWDGRPGGLFVTYHDELRLVALRDARSGWRQGNGVVAAGVNWAY